MFISKSLFNEFILNILENYLPNEFVTINDQDPLWTDNIMKSIFFEKQEICKTFIKNGRKPGDFIKLQNAIIDVLSQIDIESKNIVCRH